MKRERNLTYCLLDFFGGVLYVGVISSLLVSFSAIIVALFKHLV